MITLFLGATGFIYSRILEERIHHPDQAASADEDTTFTQPTKNEPVTFLLLGSDTRGTDDVGRSDTIMILRVNPQKKIAYLISIPRDTRVRVPGRGTTKINAAYQYGGVKLMAETVQEFTGFDVNHYAVIDFQGFKEVVDALGGIDINVEKRIRDKFGGERIKLDPGMHHFDGKEALNYVRIRHVDDDFGRIGRQQQFLRAVMDKMMSIGGVLKIPKLVNIASHNVSTDSRLGITEMIRYGQQMESIGRENLHMVTLPGEPKTIDGISYVIADEDKVAWMLDRIKNDMPLELTAEEKRNESINIAIKNGSGMAGMAMKMAGKLKDLNFKVVRVGNAESFTYDETKILASEEKTEIAQRVQAQLGFGSVDDR
jgi:LCP family protein required for cell wall assembly